MKIFQTKTLDTVKTNKFHYKKYKKKKANSFIFVNG